MLIYATLTIVKISTKSIFFGIFLVFEKYFNAFFFEFEVEF